VNDARQIAAALAQPFEASEVKFKPQSVKGNRALAMAYVSARTIMDRLDEVLGAGNWQDSYDLLPDGSVMCRLAVRIQGEWIVKADVGSPSDQPDGGDRLKAAFSDALKRAAVKFGIARYLGRLPAQWVDYDPAKKQIVRPPQLPSSRLATSRPANGRPIKQSLAEPALVNDGHMVAMWIESARSAISAAQTMPQLVSIWNSMSDEIKGHCIAAKDARKRELAQHPVEGE
jgi:hypothetical protein